MDALELKRAKGREKKQKQREKLKLDQEKYAQAKKKDADRKKSERQTFKDEVQKHPRKYKSNIEKNNALNRNRVKRCREKKANQEHELSETKSTKPHPQKIRREKEAKRVKLADEREKEKKQKEANRRRVNLFRLRVRLQDSNKKSPASSPLDLKPSPATLNAYQHKSSEARAFKRVAKTLPETPAKKARLIEKLVLKTTPRSRRALQESPIIKTALNNTARRKLSDDYGTLKSLRKTVSELRNLKTKKSSVKTIAKKLVQKSVKISVAKTVERSVKYDNVRKTRKDKVSNEDVSLIQNFYLEQASRQMPNKRDVLLLRDETGVKTEYVQKHIMEMSQESAFKKFKEVNPNVKVNKRKFDSLRPIQVKRTNLSSRIVCCCTYCENIRQKVQTLNKVAEKKFKSSSEVLESTLCPKAGLYHSAECVKRQCENCGTKKLREQFAKEDQNQIVKWQEWGKQTVPLDAVRNVTRTELISREAPFSEFMDKFCSSLDSHAGHVFRANWQSAQFRECVNTIKDRELIMAMDFSENYTCRYGREVQSFHWNQRQITIHPMMLYYKKDGELKKEGFTTITDDLKHDTCAVSNFEQAAIQHVRDNGIEVDTVHEWTDGCASQYKGRQSFADISLAETKNGVNITRNFFETSHGKGPCDGLGGIIKRKVSNAVVQDSNVSVTSANDLFEFCENNLTNVGESSFNSRQSQFAASSRSLKLVQNIDRSDVTNVRTLPGTRKLHSVASTGLGYQLKVRSLSCYCEGCRNKTNCTNVEYVEQWEGKSLKPINVDLIEEQQPADPIEIPVEIPEDRICDSDSLEVNQFVAVRFQTKKSKLCYFAKVTDIESDEVCVEYLEHKDKYWQYPEHPEESWQSVADIICKVPDPTTIVSGTRIKLDFQLLDNTKALLSDYKLK